eukprot:TRINITY_DN9049_c0_g5_i1.p1 TRINITY_DN9049_c0_g5~~TRINITY_DN9049_c0_g5_i1.p1  ORF type:complete len:328 (+),score=63.86 TRINITY_DN9049_c0_g5_i1:51-1034(+)
MKCAPIIRGCSYVKIPVGLVFICGGIYLLANPFNYECGTMVESCPGAVRDILEKMHSNDPKDENYTVTSQESDIENFCTCFSTCPNYFVVYEETKTMQVPTNCFQYMPTFGFPLPAGNTRRLRARRLGDGGQALPGFAKDECESCESLEGYAKTLQVNFAISQLLIGALILGTAAMEHLEIKFQSKLFSTCVIITDFFGGAGCVAAIFVSGFALLAAHMTCNSEAMEKSVIDGGNDSSQDPDDAAMFKHFLEKMLEPLLSDICASKAPLIIYHVSAWLGLITLSIYAKATLCVCMGCSDDGQTGVRTPDDMRALALQQLHNTDDDQW